MTWSHEHAAALASVFEALNRSGIPWLVLRNYEGLPEENRSKDIDLGLEKKDINRTVATITKALAPHGFSRVYTQFFQYVRCCTYFKVSDTVATSIKIDLLDGFAWRGAQIFEFKDLYSARVPYRDFFVPSDVDDGVMLWMKPLLTGGIVKQRYAEDIRRVSDSHPVQFRERLNRAFSRPIADEVWPLIEQGCLLATVPYKRRLAHAAWLQAARQAPARTLAATMEHFYSEIARRSRRNPASLLAVAGPDGVGKTTFIELLQSELARVLVKDLDDIEVKHFRPHILPNIKQLLSGKKYDVSNEEFSKPHRAAPASAPSSLVRLAYYWADYLLGYWLVNRRKCARGTVMIFDRYFYDFIVDPRRSRIKLPTWLRKLFLYMTPQPDLVFFLDCDAEIVYARKQELPKEEIERQLSEYRKLAAAFPGRFVQLDARQAPDISCRQALRELVLRSFPRA